MADSKITDLTAATAAAGDEIPANRSGADNKLLVEDIAAIGRGITTIDSGNLPAAATKAITGIPQTYAYLILVVTGWSQGTNTAALRVRAGNGGVYDTTATNYQGLRFSVADGTGLSLQFGAFASMVDGFTQTAAQIGSACLVIEGYQAGPPARFNYRSKSNTDEYTGLGTYLGTTAIDSLEISTSAAGSFDAGTYALYGVR